MTTFSMKPQTVQAWRVSDVLEAYSKNNMSLVDGLDLIAMYMQDGKLAIHQDRKVVSLEVRGQMFDAPEDYWIVYNHGWFEAVTEKYIREQFEAFEERPTPLSSVGREELEHRFGFHKAAIERPENATNNHKILRKLALEFAVHLDSMIPHGREKSLALTNVEEGVMWAHKALARENELVED